jgi:hypothetical protein
MFMLISFISRLLLLSISTLNGKTSPGTYPTIVKIKNLISFYCLYNLLNLLLGTLKVAVIASEAQGPQQTTLKCIIFLIYILIFKI